MTGLKTKMNKLDEHSSLVVNSAHKNIKELASKQYQNIGFPKKSEDWLYWTPDEFQPHFENQISDNVEHNLTDVDITISNGVNIKIINVVPGVCVEMVSKSQDHPFDSLKYVQSNSLSLLALSSAQDIICIHITENQMDPIKIASVVSGLSIGVAHCPIIIRIYKDVEALIHVDFKDFSNGNIVSNNYICCELDEGAHLTLIDSQSNNNMAQFFSVLANVQTNATFTHSSIITNNHLTRRDTEINVNGSGAKVYLNGLSVLSNDAKYFHHINMNHTVGQNFGDQVFRNILAGKSLSEFSGLVNVNKHAHDIISNQSNKNLILSDSARALSRPKLIIDADDVECSHGCTVGQLNPEEIHYIRSRGMSLAQAQLLLLMSFADSVLDSVTDAKLNEKLKTDIDQNIVNQINER